MHSENKKLKNIFFFLILFLLVLSFGTYFTVDQPHSPNASMHDDTTIVYNPEKPTIWNTHSIIDKSKFLFSSNFFVIFLIFNSVPFYFSFLFIKNFRIFNNQPFLFKLFSSYPIGYLIFIGIIRILSFFISTSYLIQIISFFSALILFYLTFKFFLNKKNNEKFKVNFLHIIILLLIFIFYLIFTIQFGRNHLLQDSNFNVSKIIFPKLDDLGYIPIILKQYDEILFTYLQHSFSENKLRAPYFFWINVALYRVSFTISIFYFIKIFVKNNFTSIKLTFTFLCFPMLLLDPFYKEFSGGAEPLLWHSHPTKLVGLYIIFIFYELLTKDKIVENKNSKNFLILFFLGIGFSAVSIHIIFFTLILLIIIFIQSHIKSYDLKNFELFGILFFYISIFLTFFQINKYQGFNGLLLLVFTFCMLLYLIFGSKFRRNEIEREKNLNFIILILIFGVLVGLLFFGNQIYSKIYQTGFYKDFILRFLSEKNKLPITDLGGLYLFPKDISFGEILFKYNGCLNYSLFCKSLSNLMLNFGLILTCICIIFYRLFLTNNNSLNQKDLISFNILFFFSLSAISFSYYIVTFTFSFDFTYTWIMSRFLDFGYNWISLIFLIIVVTDIKLKPLIEYLFYFTLLIISFKQIPLQFLYNLKYFISLI
jgi:hypothetical protein